MDTKYNINNKYFVLLCLLFMGLKTDAQNKSKKISPIVECQIMVKYVDSEYLLFNKLFVKSQNDKIKIHRILSYGIGNCNSEYDCRFFLQKVVRNNLINITFDDLKDPLYGTDSAQGYFMFRQYGAIDSMPDSIPVHLGLYYPLEIGDYRLRVETDYYYDKIKYTVSSDWYSFEVASLPTKNSF